jgi:hypothetical protein
MMMMMSLDLIDGIKWCSPLLCDFFCMQAKEKKNAKKILIGLSHSVLIG